MQSLSRQFKLMINILRSIAVIDVKYQTHSSIICIFHIIDSIEYYQQLLMEQVLSRFQDNDINREIKGLLLGIHNTTIQMDNTFEEAIIRHEEQFIKTYKTKITQLTMLFEELTKVIEDKFINNALTNRLDIVLKERDYFKYQCLKLNMQYQTIQNQKNSLNGQISNVIEQMNIYKHLLQDEKLRNKVLEQNISKIRNNFSNLAYKSLSETGEAFQTNNKPKDESQFQKTKKKLEITMNELKQKHETIRNLKIKQSQLENRLYQINSFNLQHKELYDVFKGCVASWKRDIATKQRNRSHKDQLGNKTSKTVFNTNNTVNLDKIQTQNKKQLLRSLFTSSEFLDFIEKLLFSNKIEVEFIQHLGEDNHEEIYMKKNRRKLYDYMRKKKIIHSPIFHQIR